MNTFLAFHFIMCHKLVRIFIFKTKAIYLLYKAVKDRMCNVRGMHREIQWHTGDENRGWQWIKGCTGVTGDVYRG